jgi:hypothetical protein
VSRRLQDLFWDIDLTSTEQLVAQRLAWHADDVTGKCWPGIATLCAKTGLKERAVQKSIQALKEKGHLTREEARGLGVVYFVHPRITCAPVREQDSGPAQIAAADIPEAETPASGAPVDVQNGAHEVHPRTSNTPAPNAPTPARRAPKQVKNPSDEYGEGASEPAELITGQRGKRIDIDWQPTLPLPEAVAKVVDGWPPGRLTEILDEFRDYWLADAGSRATKRDWDRTWWNRLRTVISHDRRREEEGKRRNGNRSHHERPSGWAARPGMEGAEPAFLED